MKVSKALVIPLAGLLLVVAAGAVLATSAAAPAAGPAIVVAVETSPSPALPAGTPLKPEKDTAIGAVLDDLVAKGTITAAQKTAILDALATERAARRADRQKVQAERKATRELVKGFLSDGVITKAELDQLPADHPLRQLTSLMDDGKITVDELKSLGRGGMKGLGGGHGWKHFGQDKPNPSASPAAG